MGEPLRLFTLHAHPDDEVIPTGGTLARCRDEGIETVLVTCTDGRQGFAPGFANPGEAGHDPEKVARIRSEELEASAALLGITHLERLGYFDSGMTGWAGNRDPQAFCNAALEDAVRSVRDLVEKYRPQVLVTYDERLGLGHPDHVMAYRVGRAVYDACEEVAKFYLCLRSARFREKTERARRSMRLKSPRPTATRPPRPHPPDSEITTVVDTAQYATLKQRALFAHESQLGGSHWLEHGEAAIRDLFAVETYIRLGDRTGAPLPESDLFAGLR